MIVFFMALFLLLNSYPLFLFYNHQKTVDQYDEIINRLLIFNDTSQATNELYSHLGFYLNKKEMESYTDYSKVKEELIQLIEKIDQQIKNTTNEMSIINYQNMIRSYIDESDNSLETFIKNDVETFPEKQRESLKLLEFIQQETLELLKNDVTEFKTFYTKMTERNRYMDFSGISLFIATFMSGLLAAYLFSRYITNPIHSLTKVAGEIAKGNLHVKPIDSQRKDELGFLTKTVNQMRLDLSYYVKQIREKSEQEKLLKEMELKSLQSQINPHFLFNALNTIARTAYLEESKHIANLITSLSKMLRYNLGKLEKPVTLKDEISNVHEYFYIQKTRFGDRVHFKIHVDKQCETFRLPILTIQPLVENAFVHGIESLESGGVISVDVWREQNFTIVEIADNGMGMEQETIEQILNHQDVTHLKKGRESTGLGLANVIRRLELFYHREDVVQIDSEINGGTKITLKLGGEIS